jgi:GNAT superfamily N-acetyltransferase
MRTAIRDLAAGERAIFLPIIMECREVLRQAYKPSGKQGHVLGYKDDEFRAVGAFLEELPVGYVEYILDDDFLYFQKMSVAAAYQRQGIGRQLVSELSRRAKLNARVKLRCGTVKETGNYDVYSRLGFKIVTEKISDWFIGVSGKPVTEAILELVVS